MNQDSASGKSQANPALNQPKPKSRFVKKLKRYLYIFLLILFIIAGAYVYWKYSFTYSEGFRAGELQKFSHKGTIFKTYEGEMVLSSIQSAKSVAIASEKFLFSVTDKRIAAKLDSLQGNFVTVHYTEKNGTLPWRGESKYLVDSVRLSR